jgi:hypothetical protein
MREQTGCLHTLGRRTDRTQPCMWCTRALIVLQLAGLALGKTVILDNLIVAPNGFEYLTKFCFSTIGGLLESEVDYDPTLVQARNSKLINTLSTKQLNDNNTHKSLSTCD